MAQKTVTLIDKMGLPLPKNKAFLKGVGCHILFLTKSGLAIKILNQKSTEEFESALGNDLVLQPLKYVRLPAGSFMVLPGIENINEDESFGLRAWNFLDKETENTSFEFLDQQTANIGLLPVPWEIAGDKQKFPVVLDHGCIYTRTQTNLKSTFNKAAYNGLQERIFGNLKRRLLECWPENKSPDPFKMKVFFKECAEIVAKPENDHERILVPGWKQGNSFKVRSAVHYQRQIDSMSVKQKLQKLISL